MVQVESWNVTSNLAQGLTLAQLVKYVGKRWKDVAFSLNPRCLLRLLSMLLFAVLNSVLAWMEKLYVKLAGIDLEAIELHGESIVFIIGAPRSGTTLLQSFLAQSGEFATAKTLDVAFPNSMVLMRSQFFPSLLLKLIEMSIPTTRPMDAMPLDLLTTPQEDEIATNVLSCGYSPYAALSFLGSRGEWREYLRYNSFESFDLDGPEEDLAFAAWQSALKTFLRKLKYLNPGKTLLLKSPCHTARCDLLQSIFGGRCRFVHVHREPKAVIQSSLHMASTYFPSCYLIPTSASQVVDYTLQNYVSLYRSLFESQTFARYANHENSGFVEVGFQELDHSKSTVADVLRVMQRIFGELGMETPTAAITAYLDDLLLVQKFTKNSFGKLDQDLEGRIARETSFVCERYDY